MHLLKNIIFRSLENYTFVDEMGKDQGVNIRHKVTDMLDFIQVFNAFHYFCWNPVFFVKTYLKPQYQKL